MFHSITQRVKGNALTMKAQWGGLSDAKSSCSDSVAVNTIVLMCTIPKDVTGDMLGPKNGPGSFEARSWL